MPNVLPHLSLAVLGVCLAAAPAAAQQAQAATTDSFIAIIVQVMDQSNGAPVAGAEVTIAGYRAVTDSTGGVRMLTRAGARQVAVRRLGYQPGSAALVHGSNAVAVTLDPLPLRMREVQALARSQPHSPPLRRFYERLERGHGAFITRNDIDRRKPRRLIDVFYEVPGVRIMDTRNGEKLIFPSSTPFGYGSMGSQSGDCPVQYYLDGMSWEPDVPGILGNDIRPNEVEGIEVYRRLTEVPTEFRRPGSECGVVLIWLKERV